MRPFVKNHRPHSVLCDTSVAELSDHMPPRDLNPQDWNTCQSLSPANGAVSCVREICHVPDFNYFLRFGSRRRVVSSTMPRFSPNSLMMFPRVHHSCTRVTDPRGRRRRSCCFSEGSPDIERTYMWPFSLCFPLWFSIALFLCSSLHFLLLFISLSRSHSLRLLSLSSPHAFPPLSFSVLSFFMFVLSLVIFPGCEELFPHWRPEWCS